MHAIENRKGFKAFRIWTSIQLKSNKKGQCQRQVSTVCGRQVAACLEDRKISSLSPGQGNLENQDAIINPIQT